MDNEKGLEKLQLWQKSLAFATKVYRLIVPQIPPEEKWIMTSQLRKAVQSIPANIAKGSGLIYYQDNVRFCYIARGSLEATFSHLRPALDLGFISQQDFNDINTDAREIRRMLSGYIAYLKRTKRGDNEPGSKPGTANPTRFTLTIPPAMIFLFL